MIIIIIIIIVMIIIIAIMIVIIIVIIVVIIIIVVVVMRPRLPTSLALHSPCTRFGSASPGARPLAEKEMCSTRRSLTRSRL